MHLRKVPEACGRVSLWICSVWICGGSAFNNIAQELLSSVEYWKCLEEFRRGSVKCSLGKVWKRNVWCRRCFVARGGVLEKSRIVLLWKCPDLPSRGKVRFGFAWHWKR